MDEKIEIVKYAIQNLIHKAEQKYNDEENVSVIGKQAFTIFKPCLINHIKYTSSRKSQKQ